jgi:hypothetical protein
MIAGPGRDWIAWFATARWNAGANEAPTARSFCFGSFARKVSPFAREASEGCHAEGEGGLPGASEAAIVIPAGEVDCFVAFAPRNDGEGA